MDRFVKEVIILRSSYIILKQGFLPKSTGLDFPDPPNSCMLFFRCQLIAHFGQLETKKCTDQGDYQQNSLIQANELVEFCFHHGTFYSISGLHANNPMSYDF